MQKPLLSEWIEFESSDRLLLPGMLFRPEDRSDTVVISLHGNGSSAVMYNHSQHTALAQAFTAQGVAYFPFQNRGAHYVQKLYRRTAGADERAVYGVTYELIRECPLDIDGAVKAMRERGFKRVFLLGFSTGANKIVVYDFHKKENTVDGYILACGGDDSGIYYEILGHDLFLDMIARCRKAVSSGKGRELVREEALGDLLISYQSLLDTIDPDGDYNIFPFYEAINGQTLSKKKLFKEFSGISKPTLVVYGDQDEYCYGDVPRVVEILKEHGSGENFTYEIIPGADHRFTGKNEVLGEMAAQWVVNH